jgi:uncharacterized membrane protein YjjP (DUF1212 family)
MEHQKCLETAILAGEILIRSGAETYRVEETMRYILSAIPSVMSEAFALPTGVFASILVENQQVITLVKRIDKRGINLSSISEVNVISREVVSSVISMDEAYHRLTQIKPKAYSRLLHNLSIAFLIAGFVILLNGSLFDSLISLINGIFLILVLEGAKKIESNPFISTLIGAMVITIGAIFLKSIFKTIDTDVITIASMMPLAPGTAITNAIRDTLQGDYMSGSARALEAVVIAVSIAIGVACGLGLLGGLL